MATLTEAMIYTKDDETVTVPAKLFVDLVEACGWVSSMAAGIDLSQEEDPDAVMYLTGESQAIKQRAVDWMTANWRPIDKGDCEF